MGQLVALAIAEVFDVNRTGVAHTRVLTRPQANGARFVQANDALVVSLGVREKASLASVEMDKLGPAFPAFFALAKCILLVSLSVGCYPACKVLGQGNHAHRKKARNKGLITWGGTCRGIDCRRSTKALTVSFPSPARYLVTSLGPQRLPRCASIRVVFCDSGE
jgi:hypothetical protein